MPATFTPPTERQLRFYNQLATERGLPTIAQFDPSLTRRGASAAIDQLMLVSRRDANVRDANAADASRGAVGGSRSVPTPSASCRAGRMLLGGGIEATVTMANGEHVTVRIRTRKPQGRGWANAAPGEQGARTSIKILDRRVGRVDVDNGEWRVTLRTRSEVYARAIGAVFQYAAMQTLPAGIDRVQEAHRCGRCMLPLTDPISIDRGIGPDCYGAPTGSRHAHEDSPDDPSVGRARLASFTQALTAVNERMENMREQFTTSNASPIATFDEEPVDVQDATITEEPSSEVQQARAMIVEALDAYFEDDTEVAFALRVFDRLKEGE